MANINFNKLQSFTEGEIPKSRGMGGKFTTSKFINIPIEYGKEYFHVSGEYSVYEDDIEIVSIEADDEELNLPNDVWDKIKDVVVDKLVRHGIATNQEFARTMRQIY